MITWLLVCSLGFFYWSIAPQSSSSPHPVDRMTGTWSLNRPLSEGLTGGLNGAEVQLVVERQGMELTVEQVVRIRGRRVPAEPLRYRLDGRESTAEVVRPLAGTMELAARLIEKGRVLELKSSISGDNQGQPVTLLTRETWELIEQDAQLQVVRVREWNGQTQQSKLVFQRR